MFDLVIVSDPLKSMLTLYLLRFVSMYRCIKNGPLVKLKQSYMSITFNINRLLLIT